MIERDKEPLYRVQAFAIWAAEDQLIINIFRRLLLLPILRHSKEAEIAELARHGYGPEYAADRYRREQLKGL
jgi:hypothetical protein